MNNNNNMFDKVDTKYIRELFKSINKGEEFEVMFKNFKSDNKMSVIDYMKMIKFFKWRSDNYDLPLKVENSLDISYNFEKDSSYRITIDGNDNINEILNSIHDRKNHVIFTILITQFAKNNFVNIISKEKQRKHVYDINKYDIRFRKSKEKLVDNNVLNSLANLPLSQSNLITYRYKQRISLILSEKDSLSIDLTIIKFSKNPNDLANADKTYELEIDYSPEIKVKKEILNKIFDEVINIKKILDESNSILPINERKKILKKYTDIMYNSRTVNRLFSMQPISAEVQHIIDKIPNKYSVTDKADGEKFALVITNGNMYFISGNMDVRLLDYKVNGLKETILEGELIHITSQRKYLYMIFDCLYYDGVDIRNEKYLEKRLEKVNLVCKKIGVDVYNYKKYKGNFDLNLMKKFYKNEIVNFYDNINNLLGKLNNNDILFHPKMFLFSSGGSDSEVFLFSDLLWTGLTKDEKVNCPYKLDGIIYTGIEQKYTIDKREQKYPIYKYKPPSTNSVDVFIRFEKNPETGGYLDIFDNSLPQQIEDQNFRVINLFVGEFINDKEVPVPFMKDKNNDKAFFPLVRGEVRDIEGDLIQDETVIELIYTNDPAIPHRYRWTILRTRWDKTETIRRIGKKYGNYKDVAIKTWKSMIEAITIEDIRRLSNPETYVSQRNTLASRIDKSVVISDRKQDIYYQKISNLIHEMRDFHNWIKSILIYLYCSPKKRNASIKDKKYKLDKKSVLDIGCGRGGDILKWYHARVGYYVGIDVDYEGINSSIDGAISRYNNLKGKYPDFPQVNFLQLDGSLPLELNAQTKRFPNLTNFEKNKITKIFTKDRKFDIISSQFAIHYLFDSQTSVDNLINNIKEYLKVDGYVLMTLFDSSLVDNSFDGNKSYTSSYTDDDGNRQKLFEIVKKYDKVENKPGIPIDVMMGWVSDNYMQEYLVSYDLMVDTMKKAGCTLIDSQSFKYLYNVNKEWFEEVTHTEENKKNKQWYDKINKFYGDLKGAGKESKYYSFLNRYYVFKKID